MFEGFEVFDFTEGVPYVSVTKNGLAFNSAAVKKLGSPEYVLLLINTNTKQIAIQVCEKETPKAVRFFKEKKSGLISARWNGKDLMNTITEFTGWNLSERSFRIEGTLIKEENAMLFDFNNAKPME